MWIISYWIFPVISALMWLGMLLGMLISWSTYFNYEHYPSMEQGQNIAYISDVGAFQLKPLFVGGSVVTVVLLDIGIIAERWLRHTGRLARNTSKTQKFLSVLAILFAIAGAAGLILLSNFDTNHYPNMHDGFLLLFIGGYILSAICLCAEYQRLGIHYRNHKILAISFWIKLAFIVVELILAIIFASCSYNSYSNVAAVFEWTVAFVYTFWVLSFIIDLLPSVRTRHHVPQGERDREIAMEEGRNEGEGRNEAIITPARAAELNRRFSQESTRQGSYEQNLTNDSAGPNRPGGKYTTDGQNPQQKGRLARLFSNLY